MAGLDRKSGRRSMQQLWRLFEEHQTPIFIVSDDKTSLDVAHSFVILEVDRLV
jgi:ABC-type molybdate transport system ATPase subunit